MPETPDAEDPAPVSPRGAGSGQIIPASTISAAPTGGRFARPRSSFDVSGPYATTMRLSLGLAVVPGLGTGLLLVLVVGLRLPVAIAFPQLAQGHGQAQALGFVLLFIVAVGLQLFPRFLGAPLQSPWRAAWGAELVTVAVLTRLVAQPLGPGPARTLALLFATLVLPIGALVAGSAFHGLSQRSVQPMRGPVAAWRQFVVVGGLALGGALGLHVWAGLTLAAGEFIVPQGIDESLIHLELAGFATCLIFTVSSRILVRFLLLRSRPVFEGLVPRLALGWAVGLGLVSVGWLLDGAPGAWARWLGTAVELVVLCLWLWQIGLYDHPSRESGTPHVTNPTRRWIRLAFGFLLIGLVLDAGLFGREALLGVAPSSTALSAARHALAQGFLLPLMVSMAARLLPVFSADVLKRRWLLEATVDLLLVGALMRVGAEAIGGYEPLTGPLVALGGTLGVAGFCVFAVGMWSALGRLPGSAPSVH